MTGLDRAVYFAPRGRTRLIALGNTIAHRYLHPEDRLIGLVGEGGAGKSLLICGMFPGLVLTNDDSGVNVRPLPVLEDAENGIFRFHTYHIDARFETAFVEPWRLATAVADAIGHGKRVVVEHFEQIYAALQMNAELLLAVGEDVIVTRPNVFGPDPERMALEAARGFPYRCMAHSAEDLTSIVLEEMGVPSPKMHGDVKKGFVLEFQEEPIFELSAVERRVKEIIARDVRIAYYDDDHIQVESLIYPCSGPRIHVRRTGEIKGFRLLPQLRICPFSHLYLLVGLVGEEKIQGGNHF